MGERLGGIFFVVVGVLLLANAGGVARLLADLGRRQRKRWGHWATAGTRQTAAAVRLLGVAFVLVGAGIAMFPPS